MSLDADINAVHIFIWSDEKHSKKHASSFYSVFPGGFYSSCIKPKMVIFACLV